MALTKKEQQEFEQLKTKLALHFTEPVEKDVDPPSFMTGVFEERITTGFVFNHHSKMVSVACSSLSGHAIGNTTRTTSQLPIRMFSSRLKALKAMRCALEMEYAKELRRVDIQIEKELEAQKNAENNPDGTKA